MFVSYYLTIKIPLDYQRIHILIIIKLNTNLTIPKLRTCLEQSGPDYVFVHFCVKFKIKPQSFYYLHHLKKKIHYCISF